MTTFPAKVIRPVVGNVYEAIDGTLYAYSGMINYDVTASFAYRMLQFSLTKDSRFRVFWNADWRQAQLGGADLGLLINIDGIDVVEQTVPTANISSYGTWVTDFYIPENAETTISLLNPSAGAGLVKGNIIMNGKYLTKAEGKASAGVQVGDDAKPPMLAQMDNWRDWEEQF